MWEAPAPWWEKKMYFCSWQHTQLSMWIGVCVLLFSVYSSVCCYVCTTCQRQYDYTSISFGVCVFVFTYFIIVPMNELYAGFG